MMANKNVNKKRKREAGDNKISWEERIEQEKLSYYNRLHHQCQKDLHKQIKIAKSFECQKLIRKIKESKVDAGSDDDNRNDVNSKDHIKKMEIKLIKVKELPLEPVVQECFRRLGIEQLNPSFALRGTMEREENESEAANQDDTIHPSKNADQESNSSSSEEEQAAQPLNNRETEEPTAGAVVVKAQPDTVANWMKDRILQHKRLQSALEKWNDEITEFRRWCLRQDDRKVDFLSGNGSKKDATPAQSKKAAKSKKASVSFASSAKSSYDDLSNSLFVKLGGDDEPDRNEKSETTRSSGNHNRGSYNDPLGGSDNHYGPAGELPKKNRSGQRARRAKAMAIEAKNEGRSIEKSINWRQPKQQPQEQEQHFDRKQGRDMHYNQSQNGANGEKQKDDEQQLHPSWQAARKSQQQGIVQFQGKKITFD